MASMSQLHQGPQKIESVLDWKEVVRKYRAKFSKEALGLHETPKTFDIDEETLKDSIMVETSGQNGDVVANGGGNIHTDNQGSPD